MDLIFIHLSQKENDLKVINPSNEIEYDLTKPMGDLGRFADYSLAKSELNWSPSVSLKSGVYDLIDYIYTDLNK